MAVQVLWFKKDLRVTDHLPLFEAAKGVKQFGRVLPLYVHEDLIIQSPYSARQHQAFVWECLDSLNADLQGMGGALGEVHGDAVEQLDRLHAVYGISRILAHQESSTRAEYTRDKAVRAWCKAAGVALVELPQDNMLRKPAKAKLSFQDYLNAAVDTPLKNPLGKPLHHLFVEQVPTLNRGTLSCSAGVDKPLRVKGGRLAAVALAKRFFTINRLKQYPYGISSPNKAVDACSRLSAYLAHGVVSDRHVLVRLNELVSEASQTLPAAGFEKLQSAAQFFVERLIWRQGYFQQFEDHLELEDTEFFDALKGVREAEHNPAHFDAWVAGKTGVPYVDAIQRCLDQTGWINMRARATLASFATMQLWLPWPMVARHLAQQFTDFCPAIHFGQVRIASGSSHFGQLLIYDPLKQARDHDPKGVFVRKWVPELAGLSTEIIHTPWLVPGALPADYPAPVVQPEEALKTAKARIYALRLQTESLSQLGLHIG